VANQIAAGEVVERPASIVKELVENALDAGARMIRVHIDQGGKRRIRVEDDGHGMPRDDALLAFDRHATSKITRAEDLAGIRSFGFRGEALPSIAAVSRTVLETRPDGEEVGTRVRLKGGTITAIDDVARQQGTTVLVENLFFNAPARAKFLKEVGAETRAVMSALVPLALVHCDVGFALESGPRTLLDLPATSDLRARVGQIWGAELADTLIPVSDGGAGVRVLGLLQRPDAVRKAQRRAQLFVNGRPIRDPSLLQAVQRGYRTTVPEGARPSLLLFLNAPDGSIDVNVHPAKHEVRFRDRAAVEAGLEDAVRRALAGAPSSATLSERAEGPDPYAPSHERPGGLASEVREVPPRPAPQDQMALFLSGGGEDGEALPTTDGPPTAPLEAPPSRARLWQALSTYIMVETREGLLIVDQHSAHERVMFEELMGAFERGGQVGQRLLFPLTLRLTRDEVEMVEALTGIFERAGFEVEPFGGDTVIVHAVPDPHPQFDAERCLREMVAELTEGSELVNSARNQHERIAKTFACKGSVKAGQTLSVAEMESLLDRLFATELPYHDVHGRPTIVKLSGRELARRFER